MAVPAVVVVELLGPTGWLIRLGRGLVFDTVVTMFVMPHVIGFSLRLVLAVHEDRGQCRLQRQQRKKKDENPGTHGVPTDGISAAKYRDSVAHERAWLL